MAFKRQMTIEYMNIFQCSFFNFHLSSRNFVPNGDGRVRTDGLRSASAALFQLSYIPYPRPANSLLLKWRWAWVELNYRPHAYQACALTT